jgi:hypothetical protein
MGVATIGAPRHTNEGMTSEPERHTLTPQLLLSFGPVEATWRGFLFPEVHASPPLPV